jgi:hypothetical protein
VPELPDFLVSYFEQRQAARAEAVNTFLASLTDRERALVQDAAVMGYVQGMRHPEGERCPKSKPILAQVVDACFSFPDLYPAVNADFEDHRQTVEYFVQCQQPDDSWEQCSSTTTDPQFVMERLEARRRMQPDFEYRIARRTTTTVIEIAREP